MRLISAACLLVLTATVASASPHGYVGPTGGILIACTADVLGFDIGGVCIPAGHIAAGSTIAITDLVLNPVSAFVCEDVDANAVCGDGGDPSVAFCGTATVDFSPTLVLIDGPLFGSPFFSTCGPTFSGGVAGVVTHT